MKWERLKEIEEARRERPLVMREADGEWVDVSGFERQLVIERAKCEAILSNVKWIDDGWIVDRWIASSWLEARQLEIEKAKEDARFRDTLTWVDEHYGEALKNLAEK